MYILIIESELPGGGGVTNYTASGDENNQKKSCVNSRRSGGSENLSRTIFFSKTISFLFSFFFK